MSKREIRYSIGFDVNKVGLEALKKELKLIQSFTKQDILNFNPTMNMTQAESALERIRQSAGDIETALQKSFNPKLNSISLQNFEKALKNTATGTIPNAVQGLKEIGDVGKDAFFQLTSQLLTTKKEIKETHSMWNKFGETLANTVRWKVASSVLDTFTGSIQKAWGYAKRLDQSLNDIRIVTGKSADDMERFAKQANKAAKDLGAATTNYTNASLIYYQQGLSEADVQARAKVTVKAANVTGQSASEVSEQLTAVWNGYKVVAEEAELYVDKLAAVAAETAADLEELSIGMSKVASAASTMGVDVDQLSAQLSTIISVTRQDASVVGTALKTIYARMGDLKVDGVDEFGTSLGDVSGQLQQMGINVLDQQGNLRDMGIVIEEVAAKWGTWTDAQQQAAAVAIAGKRQYNNLIALFENWDMYENALTISQTSAGTLQKQQDIYMDSIEAHLNKLTASAEKFYDALINSDSMNTLIDGLTKVVDLAALFTESIGGAGNLIMALGPMLSKSLGPQLSGFISSEAINIKNKIFNKREDAAQKSTTGLLNALNLEQESLEAQKIIDLKQKQIDMSKVMTEAEIKASDERIAAYAREIKIIKDLGTELETNYYDFYQQDIVANAQKKRENVAEDLLQLREKSNKLKATKDYSYKNIKNLNLSGISGITKDSSAEDIQKKIDEKIQLLENEKVRLEEQIALLDKKDLDTTEDKIKAAEAIVAYKKEELETIKNIKTIQNTDGSKGSFDNIISNLEYNKESTDNARKNASGKSYAEATSGQKGVLTKNKNKKEQELANTFKEADKYIASVNQKISNNTKISSENKEELNGLVKKYQEANLSEEKRIKILKELNTTLDQMVKDTEKGEMAIEDQIAKIEQSNSKVQEMNEDFDSEAFKKGVEGRVQSVTDFIGTLMSLIAVIGIVKNLGSIWNDEDLTTGEKITQTITGIISILLITIPIIKGVATTWIAAEKAKQKANKDTEKTVWASLGPYIAIAAAIAAVAVGLTALFSLVSKKSESELEKAQKQFDQAQKHAEQAKNALSQLHEEYNGILEDLSKYNEAKNALDQMRIGTDEWREAVQQLNLQVLDLISKYPELMSIEGAVSFENERYEITQEGWDALLANKKADIVAQNRAVVQANLGASLEKQNLIRKQGESAAAEIGFVGIYGYEDLKNKSDEELIELKDNLEKSTEVEDSLRNELSNLIQVIQQNRKALNENKKAIDLNRKAYLRALGDENDVDAEVYSNIGEEIINNAKENGFGDEKTKKLMDTSVSTLANKLQTREDNNKDKLKDIFDDYGMGEDFNTYFASSIDNEHVGSLVNTSNDKKSIAKYMEAMIAYAYDGVSVDIDHNKLDGKESKLGSFEINIPGVGKVKWDDVLLKAAETMQNKAYSSFLKETETNLKTLKDKGLDQQAAYFMGSNDSSDAWTNATTRSIKKLSSSSYNVLGETYNQRLGKFRDNFYNEAATTLENTGFNATDNRFLNFTQDDFKTFANNLNKAVAAGGGTAIKELLSSVTDPEQMAFLNEKLAEVKWSDPASVNTFKASLYEAGIVINEDSDAWEDFMKKTISGTRQWIFSQKSVITNLQTIKEITEDLSVGDIISDEEYNRLRAIAPEIAKMFIKTADGFKALASGDELSKISKKQYKDLNDIAQAYKTINSFQANFGDGEENLDLDQSSQAENYIQKVLNTRDSSEFLMAMGIDQANLEDQLTASQNGNTAAQDYIKFIGEQINQTMLNAANGLLTSTMAEEVWATSLAESWSEVNDSNISKEVKEKAELMWKNTYLTQLGLELSSDLVEALDIADIEKAVQVTRELELDYLARINAELEEIDFLAESAFGKNRIALLERQKELQQDAYDIAIENEKMAKTRFDIIIDGANLESYVDDKGNFNYIEFLKKGVAYDEEGNLSTTSNTIINAYNKVNEAAQAAAEASQALIDTQIEAFNYQTEMQERMTESLRQWRDFSKEFKDYSKEGLTVFEETGAVAAIEKSIQAIEDKGKDLSVSFGNLDKMNSWSLVDVVAAKGEAQNAVAAKEEAQNAVAAKREAQSAAITELQLKMADLVNANSDRKDAEANTREAQLNYDNSKSEYQILSNKFYEDFFLGRDSRVTSQELIDAFFKTQEAENLLTGAKRDEVDAKEAENYARKAYWDANFKVGEYGNEVRELERVVEAKESEETDALKAYAEALGIEWEEDMSLTYLNTVFEELGASFYDEENPYTFFTEDGQLKWKDGNTFIEDWGEELDKAHEILTSMREELQSLYDSYLQAQDEILELYDKEIQKLSTINDIYSTMADLSAIVGENTSQYYSGIASNLTQSYQLAQDQYDAVKNEYDKLFTEDKNGKVIRKEGISQEMYDKVADNLAAAANNLTNLAQQTLEAVANSFSTQIKEAVDVAIKDIHGLNLVAASESWELATAENEGYLDEVNARYGIDQLSRKIQTSIDDTDNYAAQKKLADLRAKQEQRLNDILEERGKLSQYELDRANAEYELTLKQIALEEAQQTANKMKLTRDASGNYTYQYVADQDAIAKAEEELAAAENNLYNIDKERNQTLVDEYYATMTEANEAIAEAMTQGDTERVERLREHYFGENGMITGIQSELKASSGFLKEIGTLITGVEFSNNITRVADQITSMKLDGEDGLFAKINKLIGEDGSGIKALSDATENISELLKNDGILQTVVNSVAATQKDATIFATEVSKLSNAATSVIDKLPNLVTNVKALADELDIYADKYNEWLSKQIDTTEVEANTEALGGLTRSINELKDTLDNGVIDGSIKIEGWSFGDDGVWTQNANDSTK